VTPETVAEARNVVLVVDGSSEAKRRDAVSWLRALRPASPRLVLVVLADRRHHRNDWLKSHLTDQVRTFLLQLFYVVVVERKFHVDAIFVLTGSS